MTTLAPLHFLGAAMSEPVDDQVKEVVSRKAIKQEIESARKKLDEMRKHHHKSSPEGQAIFRQILQLELCDTILNDMHIFG
jgi:hypothetical protein